MSLSSEWLKSLNNKHMSCLASAHNRAELDTNRNPMQFRTKLLILGYPFSGRRTSTVKRHAKEYTPEHARGGVAARLPKIETWPNQYRGYEITITIPEYTSICPRTGLPEFWTNR